MNLKPLDGLTEMNAEQLLLLTERFVAEFHKNGHVDSPTPTEEDIWTMLNAVNVILWICPATGHTAIKLYRQKYGEPENDNEKTAREYAHPI